jgi:hypothetical protein
MSFFRNLGLPSTTLACFLAGAPALAQDKAATKATEATEEAETEDAQPEALEEEVPAFPRLDIGVATGFNNPSGVSGGELHFRFTEYVGAGLMAGYGAWGARLTPHARLYPLGVREYGFFLEGGLSVNVGGREALTASEWTIYEPTLTLTPALGYRFSIMQNRAWGLLRAGYAIRLSQDNLSTSSGEPVDSSIHFWSGIRQHEGFLIGAAVGMAIF